MKNEEIFYFLNRKYPVSSACDFDNDGFLVGDRQADTVGILVALDCDFRAISEAKRLGCNLIVTHHPVIFKPLSGITAESVVYNLIKSDISVISMHTNLDIGKNGVADCICSAAGFEDIRPYTAADGFTLRSAKTAAIPAAELAGRLKTAFGTPIRYVAGKNPIESVLICPGSGGDYISDAVSDGFDALVTGDVKHNQFVDADNAGISLFDIGHFYGENTVVEPLAALLREQFTNVTVSTFHSKRLNWEL